MEEEMNSLWMFLFMCLIISKNHSSGAGQGLFIHSYEINQNSDMAAPFLVILITQSYKIISSLLLSLDMISVSGSSYQNQNTLNKCLFNSEKNKWKATLIYILATYMSTLSLQCWNCDFNCANASVYLDNTAHLISGLAVDLLGSGTATVFSMKCPINTYAGF